LIKTLENVSGGDMEGFFGVSRITVIPLWVVENGVFTDIGPFDCAGLDMLPYLDKQITILAKEGEILALLSVDNDRPVIRGAYVQSSNGEFINVFAGGTVRYYQYDKLIPQGSICDIRIYQGTALEVSIIGDKVSGIVNRITPAFTELRDIPVLPNAERLPVYNITSGTAVLGTIRDVVTGTNTADFYMENGLVRAVVVSRQPTAQTARVVISTTGYRGYLHESVFIQSETAFTVWSNGVPATYEPGDIFVAAQWENAQLFTPELPRIYVTPDVRGGKLQILNISREWPDGDNPMYRGFLDITMEPCGRFLVVNEIPVEEYLYAVISSEALELFSPEAAKTQAVLARSYAYNQIRANRFHLLGANIDDSFISQVYNNYPETPASINAVNQTRGFMLSHAGNVISGNFFSTSAGVTANSGDVWPDLTTRGFPGTSLPYLQSRTFYSGAGFGDLRDENNASTFFRSLNVNGYDAPFPWFRWNVEMTGEQLSAVINANIGPLYAANPGLIQTLQPNGAYSSRPVSSIGYLMDIFVTARGEGGNIMSLMLIGSEATVAIHTETVIRQLLAPSIPGSDIIIKRHVGEPVTNYAVMPSAFFVFDKEYGGDKISSVTFYGGGYGHGVGMSLNGARGMAHAGYSYSQILRSYYRDAVLVRKW
jgi:stage II sporulation protein D